MWGKVTDREYWVAMLTKICRPVLENLAERRLKKVMPVGGIGTAREARRQYTYLEALGRTLDGIAPWLESTGLTNEEEMQRRKYADWARQALDAATDPASSDCLNFAVGDQPIVDAAFLAHAILRAPRELWERLEGRVQTNLVRCLRATRSRKPYFCNWLLFAALLEACLYRIGAEWDRMRVDYALRQHDEWYRGDGIYGDGPEFHWDYYNSFVIQPMLVTLMQTIGEKEPEWAELRPVVMQRAVRYAVILERLIAPDGSFPPLGRSIAYRCGAFQHLAQMALLQQLPAELPPSQVRSALTAVIQRTLEAPGTFDANGWLTIGLSGSQDGLGEGYISTGSLYLCTTAFLPLGLEPRNEFWSGPSQAWTGKRIWSGENLTCDHALD
jgi:hypothetical protein